MGLFDKKYCDICGEKIGLLGNRKLENGNLCKNCARKLSPWFSDRRGSTVEEIRAQLAYRAENQEKVAAFHTTRTLGADTKVLLDEDAGKFMVTRARNLAEANPDVLDFADVTGCNLDIDESSTELKRKDKDGKRVKEVVDGKKVTVYDEVQKEIKKDQPSRLHARRQMLKVFYPVTEVPAAAAGKKKNTKKIDMPAKVFDEIAPKYADRKGGYTRIVKIGQRKGDGAMEVVLELI